LSATIASGQIRWYNAATGGTLLGTTNSGVGLTVSPTSTATYYVEGFTPASSVTFNYTGGVQTFTVPAGVTSINVDAYGAKGGHVANGFSNSQGQGGGGGRVQATMRVTPGQVLNIYVGGQGIGGGAGNGTGGYNGGGNNNGASFYGGAGGGATDIRIGGTALTDRVLVAGGGGGGGNQTRNDAWGGPGGGLTGGDGQASITPCINIGGTGGTQIAAGGNGTFGIGGAAGTNICGGAPDGGGGGGGGGWYGGGANRYAGGGGGSSYTNPGITQNVVHTQGALLGDGVLTISYNNACVSTPRAATTIEVALPQGNLTANTTCIGGTGQFTYTSTSTLLLHYFLFLLIRTLLIIR
jgi:hypothetical protein